MFTAPLSEVWQAFARRLDACCDSIISVIEATGEALPLPFAVCALLCISCASLAVPAT